MLNFAAIPGVSLRGSRMPIFRAAAPRYAGMRDVEQALAANGIGTVLDLQTPEEAGRDLEAGWRCPHGCRRLSIPIREPRSMEGRAWGQRYRRLIAENRSAFSEALAMLDASQIDGAALIHCGFGKDRTGLLAAALMERAGAARSDILVHFASHVSALAASGDTFSDHWKKRGISKEVYLARFQIGAEGLEQLYRLLPHGPTPLFSALAASEFN